MRRFSNISDVVSIILNMCDTCISYDDTQAR